MRRSTFIALVVSAGLVACDSGASENALPVDDSTIADAVLKDFAEWKEVTFGEQSGVLAVAPVTMSQPELTSEQVVDLAPNIRGDVTPELAASFIERNKMATSVTPLLAATRWAQIRPIDTTADPRDLPPGIKASGQISLPGFSADRKSALIQISHTWSIHGAVVTYVLAAEKGAWHIVARDQVVFL
jgi:hypothetical protein